MATSLSRTIQLKLEQTLDQWSHWRLPTRLPARPEVIQQIDGGVTNHSFLVRDTGGQEFMVRIDGSYSSAAARNRQAEWHAMQLASAAQLAPTPRYMNPALGSLVCDYLPHDRAPLHDLQQTGDLLRRIHQLPPVRTRLDISVRLRRYHRHIEQRGRQLPDALSSLGPRIAGLLAQLRDERSAAVLCHNDLLAANRLSSGGRLYAIDWEFCAMGSPWFDLAVVIAGDELDAQASERLLLAYLQGQPASASQREQLLRYTVIYRYLELLWYCALDDNTLREARVTGQRIDTLRATLAALSP